MIKTLIVEDDIFDYSHLKNMVSWEEEGFLLYGNAKNGSEAVKFIDTKEIDLIITDMSMPGTDGVELIKYVKNKYPHIKLLAVSGYDDFSYVKQSLKMGAVDYILKHNLNSDSLLGILESIKRSIRKDEQTVREKEKLEKQIKTGKDTLIQNFVIRLVREGINSREEIREELESLSIEFYFQNTVVVAAQLDDYDFLKEKYRPSEVTDLKKSFINMSNEIIRDMTVALISFIGDGKFVILFSFKNKNSEQEIYNHVNNTINRIRITMQQNFNITACFAIADLCGDISKVQKYYKKAEQLLRKKFYYGKNKVVYDNSRENLETKSNYIGIEEEKNIIDSIKMHNQNLVMEYIEEIFTDIMESQPNIDSVKLTIISFINIANKLAKEYTLDISKVYNNADNPYEHLDKYDTIQELKDWITDIYANLYNNIKSKASIKKYRGVTGKAIEYINKNYQKDISLSYVADIIGVNSSYLSRKFKKDSGIGFIEYLNNIRIEKAKSLIVNTDSQIKEIVPEVGFNNYNYFFKVFKDSQGMTPVEYEESIRS